jgi:hypothetical protein
MLDSFVRWLDNVGTLVFWSCAAVLVTVDVLAAALVIQTRSRELVNRWTGRILATNVLFLGAGLGVPAAAYVTKVVVRAVAPSIDSAAAQLLPAKGDERVRR